MRSKAHRAGAAREGRAGRRGRSLRRVVGWCSLAVRIKPTRPFHGASERGHASRPRHFLGPCADSRRRGRMQRRACVARGRAGHSRVGAVRARGRPNTPGRKLVCSPSTSLADRRLRHLLPAKPRHVFISRAWHLAQGLGGTAAWSTRGLAHKGGREIDHAAADRAHYGPPRACATYQWLRRAGGRERAIAASLERALQRPLQLPCKWGAGRETEPSQSLTTRLAPGCYARHGGCAPCQRCAATACGRARSTRPRLHDARFCNAWAECKCVGAARRGAKTEFETGKAMAVSALG